MAPLPRQRRRLRIIDGGRAVSELRAPVFVYTGNILNYVGDKLEGEICICARRARTQRGEQSAVAAGGGWGVIRKIDWFFRALAGEY